MFDPIQTGQGQASAEIMMRSCRRPNSKGPSKRNAPETKAVELHTGRHSEEHSIPLPRHACTAGVCSPNLRSTSTTADFLHQGKTSSSGFLEEQATQVAIARVLWAELLSLETEESAVPSNSRGQKWLVLVP